MNGPDGPEERQAERDAEHEAAMIEDDIRVQLADEYDELDRTWLSRSVDDMQWPTRILVSPVVPKGGK